MKNKKKNRIISAFSITQFFTYLIGMFMFGFAIWMVKQFGDVDFEQYWFSITSPSAGTPIEVYISVAKHVGAVIVAALMLTAFALTTVGWIEKKSSAEHYRIAKGSFIALSIGILIVGSVYMNKKLKISEYYTQPESVFIRDNYIEPTTSNVVFPEKKKNVVFIILESFEGTYFSKELGGNVDYNLMPRLTELIEQEGSISFSDKDTYGGGYQAPSTGYSMAGMFAQQSGLPFKVPTNNDYGEVGMFAPGAITLGDILESEGYNLKFLAGADGTFAGVSNFYQTHGDYEILDLIEAKKQNKIPEDYYVWWGYEDRKLFEYSKESMDILAAKDQPFGLVIETIDSHFPDGYTDESCSTDYAYPYENSIRCVDTLVSDFINYIQQQDYYEDTVIVLTGDHLSMDKEYFKHLDSSYTRNFFNAFINVDPELVKASQAKNRQFNSMDIFPTILESMGVNVEGDRLGIGTSLFSSTPTYYESLGIETVNDSIQGRDPWFNQHVLKDTQKYR